MELAELALGIIIMVLSLVLIVLVLMQSGKGKDLSGAIAGGTESYFNKGKTTNADKVKFICTIIASASLVVSILVFFVFFM